VQAEATNRQASASGFTHVDPFEDTERLKTLGLTVASNSFHPRRSVRGY